MVFPYGIADNGEVVNTIYACKFGDFKNWNSFPGISTDSYFVSVGSDGPFTGAVTLNGFPIFWKEGCLHKIYGDYPATFGVQTTACRGVQKGCDRSLAIVNEVLYYNGDKCGYAWCDVFVDWLFFTLCGNDPKIAQDISYQSGPYGAGCLWSAKYYQEAGRFYEDGPQPGDQIFFGDYEHTGIVEKVENGIVTTIEGNAGNKVQRLTYKIDSDRITGYGRPRYDAEDQEEPPAVTGTPSTGSVADEKTVWDFFKGKGLNDCAVAGLMGNLYAESGLRSDNLQNSYQTKLGFTDAAYTAAVDSGTYSNFVKDSAGYGLAQWTYWSRKEKLLEYAKAAGKSIGDLVMQLGFLWKEIQGYKSVVKALKAATSVKEASDAVLTGYEKPADQSDKAKTKRASYGQKYFDKYAAKVAAPATPTVDQLAQEVLQGKWGNGEDRKSRLTAAGHDYNAVQKRVNEILAADKKTVDELAREVIQGKWGNGVTRKKKLTAAGYDYKAVQKRVNELL